MKHFIVLGPNRKGTSTYEAVFADIVEGKVPDAEYLCATYPTEGLSRKLYLFFYYKHFRFIRIPRFIRRHWELRFRDVEPHIQKDKENILVFCMVTKLQIKIRPDLMRDLRKKAPGCRLVYYLIDSVERTAEVTGFSVKRLQRFLSQFDAVFTYDRHDQAKFGYHYAEIPVTQVEECGQKDTQAYDIYFCGRNKDRHELLTAINDRLKAAGGSGRYAVTSMPQQGRSEDPSFSYNKWIAYPDMIRQQQRSNCILEILAEGNTGCTLRCKEAVMYNQKLLSNNPDLESMPYYDPRWMRYFKTADDIDYEWVRRREPVDYRYQGEFSAQALLETIETVLDGAKT